MDNAESGALRRLNGRTVAVAAVALVIATLAVAALRAPEVTTVSLENRDVVRTLVLVGRVRPPSRAGLGASVAGTAREVRVREGDRVERGRRGTPLLQRPASSPPSHPPLAPHVT